MTPAGGEGLPFARKVALIVTLAAVVVALDLWTKAAFERAFSGEPTMHILGDTVRVGFVLNSGVFLSLGHALSPATRFWLFVVGVSAVLVLLAALTLKDERFRAPEVAAV